MDSFSNQNQISQSEFITEYRKQLLKLQEALKKEEQWPMPLVHEFAPGVYMRSIYMHKGCFVIGKTHKTEHFNIIHTGKATLMIDGKVQEVSAPYMFVSGKNIKKVLEIKEDMVWSTVHSVDDSKLILNEDGSVNIDATVDYLEPLVVCSDSEELELIETELQGLL